MHADRCGRSFDGAEINCIALVAGEHRMSFTVDGEGKGDGGDRVRSEAFPVVDKVAYCSPDLRAHGRFRIEGACDLLSISEGLSVGLPSLGIILRSVRRIDGAHCYGRIELLSDGGELYKSGTPKLDLLLCISNINSGNRGCRPLCYRGLPLSMVGLPLRIILLILRPLYRGRILTGIHGSNGLHGCLRRIVEIESAVSRFFPAVPGDRIEIVIAEINKSVVPIDSTFRVVRTLDCLNGCLERVNGSGNDLLVECCSGGVEVVRYGLIGCNIRSVVEVSYQLRTESIVGCHDKSRLIGCPLCVCICAVVSALTLLARILAVLRGDIIVIVNKERNGVSPSLVVAGLVAPCSLSFHGEGEVIGAVGKICSVGTVLSLPEVDCDIHVVIRGGIREVFIFEESCGTAAEGRSELLVCRIS